MDITSVVDEVVELTGRDPEKVILILQEVQKRLNWLPSEALKHICKVTDITPEQISGVQHFIRSSDIFRLANIQLKYAQERHAM